MKQLFYRDGIEETRKEISGGEGTIDLDCHPNMTSYYVHKKFFFSRLVWKKQGKRFQGYERGPLNLIPPNYVCALFSSQRKNYAFDGGHRNCNQKLEFLVMHQQH